MEGIIGHVSDEYGFYKPRMYKKKARNDYLSLEKCRKRGVKKIKKAIRKLLWYIRRDLGYMDNLLENNDVELSASDAELFEILTIVYEQ